MKWKSLFFDKTTLLKTLLLFGILFVGLSGCFPEPDENFHVKVRLKKFPESLNPTHQSSTEAYQLARLLYSPLLKIDAKGELQPYLAAKLPEVSLENKNQFTYTLRPEATWDDGRKITAHDVLFSLKVYKSPIFDNFKARYSHQSITTIEVISEQQFSLTVDNYPLDAMRLSGDMIVLPQHQLDPDQVLDKYGLDELLALDIEQPENEKVKAFSEQFNNQPLFGLNEIHGSGAYKVQNLENDQLIRLERKSNWWGDEVGVPEIFSAAPERISYFVIPEESTALRTLLNGQIDVMSNVPASDFNRLRSDASTIASFHFESPASYRFVFIGMNTRKKLLSDTTFRRALSMLMDKEAVVKIAQEGEATPTIGPVNPADGSLYHPTLQANQYDPDSAKAMIKPFLSQKPALELKYNAASIEYEKIALYFKSQAEKAGIDVRLLPLELSRVRTDLRQHDFDLMIYSFVGSRFSTDFSALFGTSSAAMNGLNFTGFGDESTDAIIEAINNAPTWEERALSMHAFQDALYRAQPAIFLYFENNRIMINQKFDPGAVTSLPPNFEVEAFTLKN